MKLHEKIKSPRRSRGMYQEDLAITLGVSRQAVSKWELGDATPDTDKVIALAEYFDVTTDWLLRDIEPQKAEPASASPGAQHERFAPMLLCIDWCGSALGLAMLLYGFFISASPWPLLVGLMLQILFAFLPLASSLMLKQDNPAVGDVFLRQFWRVNIWLIVPMPLIVIGGSQLFAKLIPFGALSKLWAILPQPLWDLGRWIVFSVLPLALYVAICLFVTLRLRKKDK